MLTKEQFENIVEALELGAIFTDSLLTIKKDHYNHVIIESELYTQESEPEPKIYKLSEDYQYTQHENQDNISYLYEYDGYTKFVHKNINIVKDKVSEFNKHLLDNSVPQYVIDKLNFDAENTILKNILNKIEYLKNTRFDIVQTIKSKIELDTFETKDFDTLNDVERLMCRDIIFNNEKIMKKLLSYN